MSFEFLHVGVVSVAGDNVLGGVVEERRAGIVLDRPRRPRRLEHLVGRAPEQDGAGTSNECGDRLSHRGSKP